MGTLWSLNELRSVLCVSSPSLTTWRPQAPREHQNPRQSEWNNSTIISPGTELQSCDSTVRLAYQRQGENIRNSCLKCNSEREDDVEMMVAPDMEGREIGDLSVSETGGVQGGDGQWGRSQDFLSSPVAGWTQGKQEDKVIALLQERVNSHSPVVVKVPFSYINLEAWIIPKERWYSGLLGGRWTGWTQRLPGTAEEHFPSWDPHWDPNIRKGRLPGDKHINQEKPGEAVQLASIFTGNSALDIKRNWLQELEEPDFHDPEKLLEVTWIWLSR
ncbi:hypothetical protein IHE44_0004838 [Lamprotornis superbus]|uniref:Uncharacterized protein n=1 Tax=Lamprotornis superbus TaxID=245042 RepID=A0A835TMY6_9PASS|nr:hypothetical protein IHE44_0004838 [Lamprotornis superbus]